MRWFLPTLWRYRKPLGHVLAASLFVQIFALTTPLIFQVMVDKVLTHRGYETLFVMIAGLVVDRPVRRRRCNICAPTRSRTPPTASTSSSGSACSPISCACR